jgi:uncharacterized membrane protein
LLRYVEVMPLVSVAGALVVALVLQVLQLAHVLYVVVIHGVLHPLGLEGATTAGTRLLDLLRHVEVGASIASRALRGQQGVGREVGGFLLLGA